MYINLYFFIFFVMYILHRNINRSGASLTLNGIPKYFKAKLILKILKQNKTKDKLILHNVWLDATHELAHH